MASGRDEFTATSRTRPTIRPVAAEFEATGTAQASTPMSASSLAFRLTAHRDVVLHTSATVVESAPVPYIGSKARRIRQQSVPRPVGQCSAVNSGDVAGLTKV